MSIDAMKQALEYTRPGAIVPVTPETVKILVDALRLAIEQAERQEPGPLANIELSRRMAAVKISNFYGSIIKDAEKEIERLHELVLQHPAPPQRQPLPAHEIVTMYEESPTSDSDMIAFARAIERKHGIGGKQ
jgi:hypothetical protein